MPSKRTTILPVRVEHQIIARLEALSASAGASRTAVARDAIGRGLELIEAERNGRNRAAKRAAPKRSKTSSAAKRPNPNGDAAPARSAAKPAARRRQARMTTGRRPSVRDAAEIDPPQASPSVAAPFLP